METKLIFKKLTQILSEVEAVGKNKTNAQQNYKFRGIDDMYNALHPVFSKHGVIIASEVVDSQREERQTKSGGILLYSVINVKFTFYAEDGSSVSSTIQGEAMDSGDKATNKAISAALKYALMQMFLIPTEDKIDTEYQSPEPTAKEEPKKEYPADDRPWMTEKQLQAVIKRVQQGQVQAIEDSFNAFKMKKEYKEKLNTLKATI
jgi:hypothetical protein